MMMKILTGVLAGLLIAAIGGGAYFFLFVHKEVVKQNEDLKAERPQLEKARTDLKKLKERETGETAWIIPAAAAMTTGLADEIKAGNAEVITAGNRVVVQIAEQVIFQPASYTFSKEATQPLLKLAALLKSAELKGKSLLIGNAAAAVQAQGKGLKRTPAKDARTLAMDRSAALIRHFEKNGAEPDALQLTAYSAKGTGLGSKVKDRMVVIVIEKPSVSVAKQEAPVTAASATAQTVTVPTATPITR